MINLDPETEAGSSHDEAGFGTDNGQNNSAMLDFSDSDSAQGIMGKESDFPNFDHGKGKEMSAADVKRELSKGKKSE